MSKRSIKRPSVRGLLAGATALALLGTLGVTSGCTSNQGQPGIGPQGATVPARSGVQAMTADQLVRLLSFEESKAGGIIIDINDAETHQTRKIDGSINIPYEQFKQRFKEIDPKKDVYIYGLGLLKMKDSTDFLQGQGYTTVKFFSSRLLNNAVVVDLNDPAIYAQTHVQGAINIPFNQLQQRVKELNPEKTVLITVRDGQKAIDAVKILSEAGIGEVRNLATMVEQARPAVQVIDVREPAAFHAGHIAGAMNLTAQELNGFKSTDDVRSKYAALNPEWEMVLVGADSASGEAAAKKLFGLGFKKVSFLRGGMPAWQKPLVKSLTMADLEKKFKQPGVEIVDVRPQPEFEKGHLDDSTFVPAQLLGSFYSVLLTPDEQNIVVADDPYKAAMSAKLLMDNGYPKVLYLEGDIRQWPKQADMVIGAPPTREKGLIFM